MSVEREKFISGETTEDPVDKTRLENAGKFMDEYLNLKPGEKILFIIDDNPHNTDPALISALQEQLTLKNLDYEVLAGDESTTQAEILAAAERCHVLWDSWDMQNAGPSVDFYGLNDYIASTGKRMAWCPGVKADSLDDGGALTENREDLEFRLNKMETKLRDAIGLRIKTWYGTDLKVPLRRGERRWYKDSGAIKKGKWDNLPGGEIFTTPDEEKVEGVLMLPVLQEEVTRAQGVDEFVKLTIKGGKIRRIDGGISAEKLRDYLVKWAPDQDDPESVLQLHLELIPEPGQFRRTSPAGGRQLAILILKPKSVWEPCTLPSAAANTVKRAPRAIRNRTST